MVDIAILGHGVVGSGVAEIICKTDRASESAKEKLNIKYILDLRDFPDSPLYDRFTKSFDDILNDDSVKIVVECMGGTNPAYQFVKSCLAAGKSVVTSNKELVAQYGDELLELAFNKNVNFLFEASVGGGIPILRPITQCLAANNITEINGILNGTTNFILTKMVKENMPFATALKTAQDLGYAERDPSADIDGLDSCRKVCILASLAFGHHVRPDKVNTRGIRDITLEEILAAKEFGYAVKLLGRIKKISSDKISAAVYPTLVPYGNMLAGVDDVFNAIMVHGDSVDDVMFYGRGAGKLPTASAVVADVIDCVKHIKARKYVFWDKEIDNYVTDVNNEKTKLFVLLDDFDRQRFEAQFKPLELKETAYGTAAIIEGVYGDLIDELKNADFVNVKSELRVLK